MRKSRAWLANAFVPRSCVDSSRNERDQAIVHQATLEKWLIDGPIPMAYAMAEGTPHSARIQLRGEPDQLGEEVPRGFIQALGNHRQIDHCQGSGRLETCELDRES